MHTIAIAALSGNGGEAPKRVRRTKKRGAEVSKRENCEALQASKTTCVCEGAGDAEGGGCGERYHFERDEESLYFLSLFNSLINITRFGYGGFYRLLIRGGVEGDDRLSRLVVCMRFARAAIVDSIRAFLTPEPEIDLYHILDINNLQMIPLRFIFYLLFIF